MAIARPKPVLYKATEMPCASWAGLVPLEFCAPKISIMPTTVPNRPISGASEAIVPRVVRKRSSTWATPRLFDGFLHDVAGRIDIAQGRGQHGAQRRIAFQLVDDVGSHLAVLVDADHFRQQLLRQDLGASQINQAFDDEGQGDDGGNQQQPDWPASSL